MATFPLWEMSCAQSLVSKLPDDFGLACEPYSFSPSENKYGRTQHPSQNKRTPFRCPFVLAGMDGFEPSKCQSQSLVPYRLATSQYVGFVFCLCIVAHFILFVKYYFEIFKLFLCSIFKKQNLLR